MRIIVTGANGFIGKALVEGLSKDHIVIPYTDDCTNTEALIHDFRKARPDIIIHLANTVGVSKWAQNPESYFINNMRADLAVRVAADSIPCRPRIFFTSSSEVYADSDEALTEESPVCVRQGPRSGYALAKLAGERLFNVNLRLFNVVGKNQNSKFAIPSMIEGAMKYVIKASNDKRTFISVDDVVRWIVAMIDKNVPDGIYNIANPINCMTMYDVAVGIRRRFPEANIILYEDGFQLCKMANIDKASKFYKPTDNFEYILNSIITK